MKKTTILVILALIGAVSKAEDRLAWIRIFNYGEDANHGYHFLILNTIGIKMFCSPHKDVLSIVKKTKY
ncbi:MAG: hypothetical protein IKQ51_03590 [Bacteroidaceae bacterium]|nr:hypothetical protein [Bacteroidaceae bacterium]